LQPAAAATLGAAGIALFAALASGACADTKPAADPVEDMRKACQQPASARDQVDSCTKLIETRSLQGKELGLALYQRGLGHAGLQHYQDAVRDFTQALKFAPASSDVLYNRGGAYSKLGRWDEAIADYGAQLALVPNDPNAFYARAWAHAQRGDDIAAIADLDQVLAIVPNDQESLMDRGGLNIRAGRLDAAVEDFGTLLGLDPKAAAAAYNRGRAHFASGDFKNAAADFQLALKLRPQNPYAALRLHLAQSHLGKADNAVLTKGIGTLDPEVWPRPLLELFTGAGTDAALINGINQLPAKQRTDVLCEAQYYLGERARLSGDTAAARDYFSAAATAKAAGTIERIDAAVALAQMK
jgi:lipoprotein NlpI